MPFGHHRLRWLLVCSALSSTRSEANDEHSQGAAVNHRAIEDLSTSVKNQIAGVVTFGDTQARRDNQQIPNFPRDKLQIFCGGAVRDTVCDGNLAAAVLLPHLSYGGDAEEAGKFLIGKINAVRGAKA
jgi:cutinase